MHDFSQISFMIPAACAKNFILFLLSHKTSKNTFEAIVTVLKNVEFLALSRDAQNVPKQYMLFFNTTILVK